MLGASPVEMEIDGFSSCRDILSPPPFNAFAERDVEEKSGEEEAEEGRWIWRWRNA